MKKLGFLLVVMVAFSPALGAAGLQVSGPFIDDQTQGDWRGVYGQCFYLIPDNWQDKTKDVVGPDRMSQSQEQYRYNNCYGGVMFSENPLETRIDWRIYRNNPNTPFATTWSATDIQPAGAQWNPCLQDFRHTTWSDGNAKHDPLTVDLILNAQGSMSLSYYFTNSNFTCRETEFRLLIDDVEVSSGVVGDFADGKYVTFDIDGLKSTPAGMKFTLEARDAAGDPVCADPDLIPGVNTHISGVFLDYHNASDSCERLLGRPLHIKKESK